MGPKPNVQEMKEPHEIGVKKWGRVWDQKVGSPFGPQTGGQKVTPGLGPGASTQPGVGGGCEQVAKRNKIEGT